MTSKRLFVGAEAVLEELDRLSDVEDSDESYDSVFEAAFAAREDPDFDAVISSDDEEPVLSGRKRCRPLPVTHDPTPTPLGETSVSTTRVRCRQSRGKSQAGRHDDGETNGWHDVTEEDVDPDLPNFTPKRPPGPQILMSSTYSTIQLFQLFFTTSVIDTIVRNTNKYASKMSAAGKKFQWVPLTAQEFSSYLALVIYMGLVNAKTIVDYWAKKTLYNFSFPRSVMSRPRFQAISWNLHLCDVEKDEQNSRKKGTPDYDKLFKVKPLYTDIVQSCQTYFQPNKHLSVDERMVASKARIGLKQYMKDKPTRWGYKLFVLADSISGYTWNFFVYEGKNSMATGKGLSYDSVMTLMNFPLLGIGYHIFMDNFYTSPTLFLDLFEKKTLACGTIRANRVGFPKTKTNDLSKKAQRGTIRWLRQGKLLFVKWRDTREVAMCSTIHKAYVGETVNRRVKNAEAAAPARPVGGPYEYAASVGSQGCQSQQHNQ
ncbi:unnamed protein product [Leuciscus chuanchicus]